MARDSRISQFDGLRALAFLAVYMHHAVHAPLMWMGVDLFFVLSGFLITRILLQMRDEATYGSALATFFYRRVLRIIPPYYVALVAMMFVAPIAASDAVWYFGFASNVRDSIHGPILGPYNSMWSIAVEEQFYLVWPWLILFLGKRALVPTLVGILLLAPICRLVFADISFDAVYRLMPARMDLLAAGALLAVIDLRKPSWIVQRKNYFLVAAIGALAVFGALTVTVKTFRTSLNLPLFNVAGFGLAMVFFASVLAYVRGCEDGLVSRALRLRPLQFIGKISYMCYLSHLLALEIMHKAKLGMIPTAILGLALTVAIATLSWYCLEQPLSKLRNRVTLKPAVPLSAT